jgi:hypothetical protein
MSAVVSALNPFLDELSFGLAKSVVFGLDSLKYMTMHTGVNGTLRLNTVDTSILFHAGSCDTTDSGTTTFAGNVLDTCLIAVNNDICLEDIQGYWMGQYMAKTAFGANDIGSLTDFIMAEKADKVKKQLEKLIWQGSNSAVSYAAVTGNLTFCDGLLQKAYELSATTAANVAKTAITASNAFVVVDTIYANATADMKAADELRIFLSPTDFDAYLTASRIQNLYHGTLDFANITELAHLGARNLKVTLANGLDGAASGTALMTYKENMNFGTLAEKDYMAFDGVWNPFARKFQVNPRFRVGVQFTFAERLVLVK